MPERIAGAGPAAEPHPPLAESIAAGIAHEVRNPLNALQINLGILEQELPEILPERTGHVFEVMAKIAARAAQPRQLRDGVPALRPAATA